MWFYQKFSLDFRIRKIFLNFFQLKNILVQTSSAKGHHFHSMAEKLTASPLLLGYVARPHGPAPLLPTGVALWLSPSQWEELNWCVPLPGLIREKPVLTLLALCPLQLSGRQMTPGPPWKPPVKDSRASISSAAQMIHKEEPHWPTQFTQSCSVNKK